MTGNGPFMSLRESAAYVRNAEKHFRFSPNIPPVSAKYPAVPVKAGTQ